MENHQFELLEKKSGYHFQNPHLLKQAMTHSSYANEHKAKGYHDNERLEFLGDAVLEVVSSEFLFRHYPALPEGDLTKLRASIVCEPRGNWISEISCCWAKARNTPAEEKEIPSYRTPWRL